MTDSSLDQVRADLEKEFGPNTIINLGDPSSNSRHKQEFIPTGSASLDAAIGGGIPRGRITEIFGPEGAGKSTLVQSVIAQAQRLGGKAAFIDTEHAVDPEYMRACGVDLASLWFSQPNTAEEALEVADRLVRTGEFAVVVIDSVASLVPRDEAAGQMGQAFIGLQARLMGQAIRKLEGPVHKSGTAFVFTNQIRTKVGVMFGNPETTPGGHALRFGASVRMRISRGDQIKRGSEVVGFQTKAKIIKNKVGPPLKETSFDIVFGEGISREADLLEVAASRGVVKKAGPYYSYGDTRLGLGKDASRDFLKANPQLTDEIESKLREVPA